MVMAFKFADMRLLLVIVLLLVVAKPCSAQLLRITSKISESKKTITLKVENISNQTVYIPNTFQNYLFLIAKSDQYPNSVNKIKEYCGSGLGLYLFDSLNNRVCSPRFVCPKCMLRVTRPIVDRKSITYKMYGRSLHDLLYAGGSTSKIFNRINKSGFILKPGENKLVKVKVDKSVFLSDSYAFRDVGLAYKPLKAMLQYANFVPRAELKDPQVRKCDTVFQGWLLASDTLNFRIKVKGTPRHFDQDIVLRR